MADNILRLRVDSAEYDAKLKKAAEGIRHLAEVAHKGGGELTGLEKSELDYIKALGEMETKSRTASGQVRELSNTYKELKVVYNQLNDVEKADEGGKALAASLETIKQRAQDAKKELADVTAELNGTSSGGKGTSGILEVLKDKFTVNIDAIKLFNIGLQAAEGALSVAKDAFFASEATVDEWGRVVDSSKSLYEGFLTALNTGDISGYLGRIDEIVTAARKAYDELDRLGTMKTIQAPKMSAQQTENERMRMMIQTGRYIAPVDGRRASMKDGQLLTPDQIRRIEAQLQNGMKTVVSLVGNEVKQTGKAIDAVYNRQAQELGMSLKEFRKGTSSMAEFDKRMAGYDQYQKWREQHTTIDMQSGRETVARGNPFEQYAKWGTFRVDGQRYNDLVRLIQQRDQQAGQAYSMQSQAYRTMNRAEGITVSKLMKGETAGGTKGGGTTKALQTELQQNQTRINELTQQYVTLMTAASEAGKPLTDEQQKQTSEIQRQISELEKRNGQLKLYQEQAKGKLLGPDAFRQQLSVDVAVNNKKIEELEKQLLSLNGITIDPKTVTITATDEALSKLREIQGITIDEKTVTITADDKTQPEFREVEGIRLKGKKVTVTANTMEALRAVQGINGVTIDPKTVTITATDDALPKLREIQGITIDEKTMTVTADTQEALQAVQGINGVTVDSKTMTVTADTQEALQALQAVNGITIDEKTVAITADDKTQPEFREVEGIRLKGKKVTVTANTMEALRAVQGINGVTIDPKTVTITATDEALPKLREIQGITIDDKTMTVTADTQEALQALQSVEGVTIDTKTVKVTAETDEARQKVEELKRQIAELKDQNLMINAGMASLDLQNARDLSRTGGVTGFIGTGENAVPVEGLPSMSDEVRQRGGNLLDENGTKALNKEEKNNEKKEKKEDKEQKSVVEGIDQLNGGINNIFGGLEQIGIEIPTELKSIFGVVQGVTTILMGIASTIIAIEALVGADTFLPFAKGGIVPKFAEGGLVPKFADGGLIGKAALGMTIPGNSYSGDNLRMPVIDSGGMIGVNSGEVILNRAQQGNLASQLDGGAAQNLKLDAVISGEQIRLVLNNNGRRTGRGEYVQSTRRRG